MAKDCRTPQPEQGNATVVREEEEWDVQALAAQTDDEVKKEEDSVLTVTTNQSENRLNDWIIDSGCSNHLTGDKEKLSNPVKYNGSRVVVIADNSRHTISHIGNVVFPSEGQRYKLKLSDVYHVPRMKKNLLSVPELTAEGKYVLFGPEEVYVFKEFQTSSVPILKGRKNESVYVLSTGHAFVEKRKDTQNADLWLTKTRSKEGHNMCWLSGKSHQEPFHSSSYRAKASLVLVHSDVWDLLNIRQ